MKQIVHATDGPMDLSAITVFGMNSKPKTNSPIGYFGTGMKYAIAVLVREGAEVELWTGGSKYKFYKQDKKFRDRTFSQIRMRKETGLLRSYTNLPFTTEYGKNWEMWQAFRELYTNTIDENGDTYLVSGFDPGTPSGVTKWIISHDDYFQCYEDRDSIFLNPQTEYAENINNVKIAKDPSKHIYYRSMRASTPELPALLTYNIGSQLQLTEDRTIKSQFDTEWAIVQAVSKSHDEELIRIALTAPEEAYEHKLDWTWASGASPEFDNVMRKVHGTHRVGLHVGGYYSSHLAPPMRVPKVKDEVWKLIAEALALTKELWDDDEGMDRQEVHDLYVENVRSALDI